MIFAFVGTDVPAWFRLWIGVDDDFAHRMEMRADGHLMDQSFVQFNALTNIDPPSDISRVVPPLRDARPVSS